jgi:hypothetical protein
MEVKRRQNTKANGLKLREFRGRQNIFEGHGEKLGQIS